MDAPFEPGERALLLDARGRRYLVRLQAGGTFHFHGGAVRHDDVLGEQEGAIVSERGVSDNNRRARFYRLTPAGRRQLQAETRDWRQTTAVIDRFFAAKATDFQ